MPHFSVAARSSALMTFANSSVFVTLLISFLDFLSLVFVDLFFGCNASEDEFALNFDLDLTLTGI